MPQAGTVNIHGTWSKNSQPGQWQRRFPDPNPVFDRCNAKDNHQWVHQNPLYPTEVTRNQPKHFAKIEAPSGGNKGNRCGKREDRSVAIHMSNNGVSYVNLPFGK